MAWTIQFSRQVLKDAKKLRAANLEANLTRTDATQTSVRVKGILP
jgi:hypothetical protein